MANTTPLQEAFEWVRGELAKEKGQAFSKRTVSLRTGGKHKFNAVSSDGAVVATVMNSSGATATGKRPSGKIRGALAELYYLTLAVAGVRLLVVTNADFLAYLQAELDGALPSEITLRHIQLPDELSARVWEVTSAASAEMSA